MRSSCARRTHSRRGAESALLPQYNRLADADMKIVGAVSVRGSGARVAGMELRARYRECSDR
jgi:hypothetical protein